MTRAAFILMSATALTACGKSAGPGSGPGGGAEIYGPPPVDARADGATMQNQPPPPTPHEQAVTVYGPPPIADAGAVPVPPTPRK